MKRLIALAWLSASGMVFGNDITLRSDCPPRFEKTEANTCRFRSLYDFYDSPGDHGGVRSRLPSLEAKYTPEQMDLGRYLFFDPILSGSGDMSCASCHQPARGLADGLAQSQGQRQPGTGERVRLQRGAPTLWNVAYLQRFMADGRAASLEDQALLPLYSTLEMANTPERLEQSLNASPDYRRLFQTAFGEPPTAENVATALAAFETTLMSFNSRYDRYAHGDNSALTPQEINGYNQFRGFVARCSQCHVPPLFTDSELAVVGSPEVPGQAPDLGAGALSDDPDLVGAFRVPTLRNISLTAPYFHGGQFPSLDDTVHFYNDTRGHAAPQDQELRIHWHIHMTGGPQLSEQDEKDIVAFLKALEDESQTPDIPERVPSGLPVTIDMENNDEN